MKQVTVEQIKQLINDRIDGKFWVFDSNQFIALVIDNGHYNIEIFDDKELMKEFLS